MPLEPEPDFTPLEQAATILIGVSGGPDSLALMHLTREWAIKIADGTCFERRIFIATVDHGLRSGSRDEAEKVSQWAKAFDLPHKILIWEGEKPRTRLQELAREARYRLLCDYARQIQADAILTAHHADDQAETILFRLLRGSGLAGLAGMEACVTREGVLHCRPLLAMPKTALVDICNMRGQRYLNDPSNNNPAFARTQLRDLSKDLAAIGLDRNALLRLGKRLARAEKAIAGQAETIISQLASAWSEDHFRVEFNAIADQPEEIWIRVLDNTMRRVTGAKGPLRLERLESLARLLRSAWVAKVPFTSTLGGTKISLELGKTEPEPAWFLEISREKPRRPRKPAAKPAL